MKLSTRRFLAAKVFALISKYDSMISSYLNKEPKNLDLLSEDNFSLNAGDYQN